MNVEEKAEQIVDLLLRADMEEEERKGWFEILPKLSKEQIEDLIQSFTNEQGEIEKLRKEIKDKPKTKVVDLIKDKY